MKMDDLAKKKFVQLDSEFPGVRVEALDSLRDDLKKAGSSFRDVLYEFETSIPQQKYSDIEAKLKAAEQHNAQWVQHSQQQEQKIAELNRKAALYKGVAAVRLNWRWVAALVALPVIGWFGYQYVSAASWPDGATAGLRNAVGNLAWGQSFDKPFVSVIGGKPYWVLIHGVVDGAGFADKDGRAVVMRCLHVFAVPADADSGMYAKPEPYNLLGGLKWPERIVRCAPSPNQEASR
jgi:hypothetical protein